MLTDDDLRAGLRDLTAAPPPAPPERVERSVRRAARIRRARAVTSAAVALAVIVPGVVVGARLLHPSPSVVVPVAQWPDRVAPERRALAERGYAEWVRTRGVVPPGESVRYLYADEPPGTDDVVVAFALCDDRACSRAVLTQTTRAQAFDDSLDDDPGAGAWIKEERALSPGDAAPLTAYLSGPSSDTGPTTVLFVLAQPDATEVWWNAPRQAPDTGGAGMLARAGAAFVGDVGYLSAPANVAVVRGRTIVHQGHVGISHDDNRLDVPNVRWVPEVETPAGYGFHQSGRMQLTQRQTNRDETLHGAFAVFVRCRGARPVTVEFGRSRRPVPCDEGVHLAVQGQAGATGLKVAYEPGDPYTALAWAVVTPRRG